jgi:hypothetical protein
VSITRRLLIVSLVLFLGFLLYHAVRPVHWTSIDETPIGVTGKTVTFTCGAPWGHPYVHAPAHQPPYPILGVPCSSRRTDRIMLAFDVTVGAAALAALIAWPRRQPEPDFA